MFLYLLKQTFRVLGMFVILLLVIRGFVMEPGRVNGQSMERAFMDDDLFLVNKYILLLREPRRGDVVQAIEPLEMHHVIKRVIGLPGEQLSIHNGHVYLRSSDGVETLIEEPWLDPTEWTEAPEGGDQVYVRIHEQEYFLMGDNRDHSTDSRVYGSVHRNNIYGLVMKPPF